MMAKTGRKKIEVDLEEVERLAGLGLTNEEIALSLGISDRTIYNNQAENSDFAHAMKKGKSRAKSGIGNVLFDKAMGGDLGAIIWFEKTRVGYSDKVDSRQTLIGDKENPIKHDHSISTTSEVIAGAIKALEGAEGGGDITDSDEDSE